MGYKQDTTWNVRITPGQLDALEDWLNGARPDEWAKGTDVLYRLEMIFGEGGCLEFRNGKIIQGGTWGRAWGFEGFDENEVLAWLSQNGATGTIDYVGEGGEMWRARITPGGVFVSEGVVTYPNDPKEWLSHPERTGCNLTRRDFGDDIMPCPDGAFSWEHPTG